MLWLTGGGFWINCVGPRLPGLGVDRAAKSIRQIANQERLRAIAFRPLSGNRPPNAERPIGSLDLLRDRRSSALGSRAVLAVITGELGSWNAIFLPVYSNHAHPRRTAPTLLRRQMAPHDTWILQLMPITCRFNDRL